MVLLYQRFYMKRQVTWRRGLCWVQETRSSVSTVNISPTCLCTRRGTTWKHFLSASCRCVSSAMSNHPFVLLFCICDCDWRVQWRFRHWESGAWQTGGQDKRGGQNLNVWVQQFIQWWNFQLCSPTENSTSDRCSLARSSAKFFIKYAGGPNDCVVPQKVKSYKTDHYLPWINT